MSNKKYPAQKIQSVFLIPAMIFTAIWIVYGILYVLLITDKDTINVVILPVYLAVTLTSLGLYIVSDIYKQLTNSKNEIIKNATIDEITGLPTSKRLMYKFEEIAPHSNTWGMAIVVINHSDNFRALFGFKLYKQHLVATGKLLTDFVTEKGTVAYLNSGRYSLIFPVTDDRQSTITQLSNIINQYSNSDIFSESIAKNYIRSYSCGTYFFDGTIASMALPTAFLKSKLQGNSKNIVTDFTGEIDTLIRLTTNLSPHINKGFQPNEFKTYYQPKFDTIHNHIIGAELFARWEIDDAIIMPVEFLPVLQNTGNILNLDLLMIKDACDVISSWIVQKIPPIPLTVNISKYSALDKQFIDRLTELMSHYKIPKDLIYLEMSQISLISVNETLYSVAQKLINLGFSLSLDDVGTENNAVELIRTLDAKVVKFSEEFFLLSQINAHNEQILKASIQFFHQLGITAVAKNIETQAHFDLAKKCGCTDMQGFLLCQPMDTVQFAQYLVDNKVQLIGTEV